MTKKLFQLEGIPSKWFTEKRKEYTLLLLTTMDNLIRKGLPTNYEDANILVDREWIRKNFNIPYSVLTQNSSWSVRKLGKMMTGFVSSLLPLIPLPEKGENAYAIDTNHSNYVKKGSGKKILLEQQLTLQWEHYYNVVMTSVAVMFSRLMGEWKLNRDGYPAQESDFYSLKKMIYHANLVFATTASENLKLKELVQKEFKKLGIDSHSFSKKTILELLYQNRKAFDELLEKFDSAYFYKEANITFHSADKEIYLPTASGYKLISRSGSTFHGLVPSAYYELINKKRKKQTKKPKPHPFFGEE